MARTTDRPGSVPVDLSNFLALFVQHQRQRGWKWTLVDGRKLRTEIDGIPHCPLNAIAISQAAMDKTVLSWRPMDMVPLSDQVKAAVVHHVDGIEASRYWNADFRVKLLREAGIHQRRKERVFKKKEDEE